jgi:hypothetical protein
MRSTRWPRGAVRGASSTLRWAGGCFATAAALTLTGCVPTPAEPAMTPSASASSSAPVVFASDEEALSAARNVYANFLEATDAVLAEEGRAPERINQFASPEVAEIEMASVAEFDENDYQLVGRAQITNATLQSHAGDDQRALPPVTLYVCVDVTEVDVLDRTGNSVVKPTRPDATTFEVTVDQLSQGSGHLIVVSKTVWRGETIC